jgi:hypothetical protein
LLTEPFDRLGGFCSPRNIAGRRQEVAAFGAAAWIDFMRHLQGVQATNLFEKLSLSTPNPTHKRGGKCHEAPRACDWIDNLKSPDRQG